MKVHKLIRQQSVYTATEVAWDFFSNPQNLAAITPQYMKFCRTSGTLSDENMGLPDELYPGQIITYTIAPILGIRLFWMTEITHVVKKEFFVDEQRVGPYKLWHHEHHFKAMIDHVQMTDIVHYQLPYMLLGNVVHSLFVRKQLNDLFDYRARKIEAIFNRKP